MSNSGESKDTRDKRIITENHNLIYSFLSRYNYSIDEYYDLAAIGLVKAVKTYNPEKGKLSSWAYKIMYNEVCLSFRKTNLRGKVKSIVSYESLIRNVEQGSSRNELTILDTLESSEENMENKISYLSDIDSRIQYLSLLEIEVLAEKAAGETQKSIAIKYGYSQTYISRVIKQAYKILTNENEHISNKRLSYRYEISSNKEWEARFNKAYNILKQVMGGESTKVKEEKVVEKQAGQRVASQRKVIYPGSFDPITLGHLDIIQRASVLFDKVIVAIGVNQDKKYGISVEDRKKLIVKACSKLSNVEIDTFDGLLADYVRDKNAIGVVKGLRAVSDFESEFQQALTNRSLNENFETIFIPSKLEYTYLSSSMVRQILKLNGNIDKFIPQVIKEEVITKYGRGL